MVFGRAKQGGCSSGRRVLQRGVMFCGILCCRYICLMRLIAVHCSRSVCIGAGLDGIGKFVGTYERDASYVFQGG